MEFMRHGALSCSSQVFYFCYSTIKETLHEKSIFLAESNER